MSGPSRQGRYRRTGLHRLGVLGLVSAIVAALVAVWPMPPPSPGGSTPFALERTGPPGGPVILTSVSTGLLWRIGALPPTTATVINRTGRLETCEVWWILGDTRSASPWKDPVMESGIGRFTLASRGQSTIPLNEVSIDAAQSGIFSLSFWVHCLDYTTKTWVHSDGVTMSGRIETLRGSSKIRRQRLSSRIVWANSVTVPRTFESGHSEDIEVIVANGSTEPVAVEVWYYLSPPGVLEPWNDRAAVQSETVQLDLNAVALTKIPLSIRRAPSPGTYDLSIWIHQQLTVGQRSEDGIWLRNDVVIRN